MNLKIKVPEKNQSPNIHKQKMKVRRLLNEKKWQILTQYEHHKELYGSPSHVHTVARTDVYFLEISQIRAWSHWHCIRRFEILHPMILFNQKNNFHHTQLKRAQVPCLGNFCTKLSSCSWTIELYNLWLQLQNQKHFKVPIFNILMVSPQRQCRFWFLAVTFFKVIVPPPIAIFMWLFGPSIKFPYIPDQLQGVLLVPEFSVLQLQFDYARSTYRQVRHSFTF